MPTSTCEKPNPKKKSTASAFLSSPAASPKGFLKVSPIIFTGQGMVSWEKIFKHKGLDENAAILRIMS